MYEMWTFMRYTVLTSPFEHTPSPYVTISHYLWVTPPRSPGDVLFIFQRFNLFDTQWRLSLLFLTQIEKWSFQLKISSVNVTKSPGNCGFGHISEEMLNGKLHFLCSVAQIERIGRQSQQNVIQRRRKTSPYFSNV